MVERGVFVIDVDDVVFDFAEPFAKYVRAHHPHLAQEHHARTGSILSRDSYKSYSLNTLTGCGETVEREVVHRFYETPEFRNLPLLNGSRAVLEELSKRFDLVVATARPAALKNLTSEQFSRIGIPIVEYFFCLGQAASDKTPANPLNKKGNVCAHVDANYFIDDSGRHIRCCLDNSPKTQPFLLRSPWNESEQFREGIKQPDLHTISAHIIRTIRQS